MCYSLFIVPSRVFLLKHSVIHYNEQHLTYNAAYTVSYGTGRYLQDCAQTTLEHLMTDHVTNDVTMA